MREFEKVRFVENRKCGVKKGRGEMKIYVSYGFL